MIQVVWSATRNTFVDGSSLILPFPRLDQVFKEAEDHNEKRYGGEGISIGQFNESHFAHPSLKMLDIAPIWVVGKGQFI
jgi:hypothetical protein